MGSEFVCTRWSKNVKKDTYALLNESLVRVLVPGIENDAVVALAEQTQEGNRGDCIALRQCELGNQLTQKVVETACTGGELAFNFQRSRHCD